MYQMNFVFGKIERFNSDNVVNIVSKRGGTGMFAVLVEVEFETEAEALELLLEAEALLLALYMLRSLILVSFKNFACCKNAQFIYNHLSTCNLLSFE